MTSFDSKSDYLRRLMFVFDVALVGLIFVAAVELYPVLRPGSGIDMWLHIGLLPIVLIVFATSRYVLGRKVDVRQQTLLAQSVYIIQEIVLTVGALVLVIFLLKLESVSRMVIISFSATSLVALIAIRRLVVWWYLSRPHAEDTDLRVLIVGSGRRARMLADELSRTSEWGVKIIGFLDPAGESAGRRSTDEILGHVDQISEILRDNVVEDVIVAVPRKMLGDVQWIIDA